jgi:D-glycero-D-manno-heptose 1,7-bisphosphate phosphatase
MANRSVFLDRDGTINEEVRHLSHEDQLKLIDGAAEAIKLLKASGFRVVVFTNQAAVARGNLSEQDLNRIHQVMADMLQAQNAHLDAIYYCPHHPTAGNGLYRIACNCRKPRPGMLERAARELKIDLSQSFVVGDKISDLEAGLAVGCRGVLVRTGYGLKAERLFRNCEFQPHYVATNVLEAAHWILMQHVRHQSFDRHA